MKFTKQHTKPSPNNKYPNISILKMKKAINPTMEKNKPTNKIIFFMILIL